MNRVSGFVWALLVIVPIVPLWGGCAGPSSLNRELAVDQLNSGRWRDALRTCAPVLRHNPDECAARYCELISQTMIFVDQLNTYILPRYRTGAGRAGLSDLIHLHQVRHQLDEAARAADETAARGCEFNPQRVPLRIGDAAEPLVAGELRGPWTPRDAHLLGAIFDAFRYLFANLLGHSKVPPPPAGETTPGLPDLLARMSQHLAAEDRLTPGAVQIDIFRPGPQPETGKDQRVFDFADAESVRGESLERGALVPSAALPPGRCGYQRWHVDTVRSGKDVGGTDGMSFSPDGRELVLPVKDHHGRYQIQRMGLDGRGARCLTCSGPGWSGSNDGVRWQPGGDVLLFISDRDHRYALGSAGGGAGQELYAMHSDGSRVTRLTHSHGWATNYHANWSPDGKRIVWGSTEQRTWDVMIADFVDERHSASLRATGDAAGPRLDHVRRLTHDTTWWETHGFSADGQSVITTNTRAGFLAADLYAIDIASGRRTRLTDDPAWDEHAHLSPDGRKLSWISGRWQPASVVRLSTLGLSPAWDFFWIIPGILFDFINHPAGYATELTLMDADGGHIQRLTFDGLIAADNQWSPDGTRIVFRQAQPRVFASGSVRILTFDDCGGGVQGASGITK